MVASKAIQAANSSAVALNSFENSLYGALNKLKILVDKNFLVWCLLNCWRIFQKEEALLATLENSSSFLLKKNLNSTRICWTSSKRVIALLTYGQLPYLSTLPVGSNCLISIEQVNIVKMILDIKVRVLIYMDLDYRKNEYK